MDLEKVINKIVDKSKWKKYRFDELVKNIVEKVVPKGSGLEHYIGLEHLDSGSVHIKRFGETESLIGDKLKIYKGDIIFAKRNAYLKRASISPIGGVASAHSLVLRMNEETVDKRFFPFFLMSEYFWERAIEISVGSLSPTINWKTLAKQEFLLPPKEQQAALAELLWAMDTVIEKDLEVLERLEKYEFNYLTNLISDQYSSKIKISDLYDIHDNLRKPVKSSDRIKGKYPYYGASGIVDYIDSYLFEGEYLLISEDGENLISRKLPIAYVATEKFWVNNHAHILKSKGISNFLVSRIINFIDVKNLITGGTRPKITKGMLTDFTVPIPKEEFINQALLKIIDIRNSYTILESKLQSSKALQKALINQVF